MVQSKVYFLGYNSETGDTGCTELHPTPESPSGAITIKELDLINSYNAKAGFCLMASLTHPTREQIINTVTKFKRRYSDVSK